MSRRKEPAIPHELLDQLLAGSDASAAFDRGELFDSLKKALTERALNAEMDHHLSSDAEAGNNRNGYGHKTDMHLSRLRRCLVQAGRGQRRVA